MEFKNLKVEPESLTKPGYNVSWEDENDLRYHIWVEKSLGIRDAVIYKNPPRAVTKDRPYSIYRSDPRFFEPRKLRSDASSNKPLLHAIFDKIKEDDLFAKADKERADRQAAVDREHAEQMRLRRMQDAAPEMFAALKDARDKIASGRAMDAYDDLGTLIDKIDG